MSFIFAGVKRALELVSGSISDSEDSDDKRQRLDDENPFTDQEMNIFLAEYKEKCDIVATKATQKGRRIVGLRHDERITYYIRHYKADAQGDECAGIPNFECTAKPLSDPTQHWHRDHITPLEGGFGGTNHIDNLQDLCVNCHAEKTARETKENRSMRFEIVNHRLGEFQVRWLDYPELELEWLALDRFTTKADKAKLVAYMTANYK